MPPSVISVAIRDGRRRFRLWLPVFLLWPLLLVMVAFVLALAVVVDMLLRSRGRSYHLTRILLGGLALLTAARGTSIHLRQDASRVDVSIR